jgi:hypothetical protein
MAANKRPGCWSALLFNCGVERTGESLFPPLVALNHKSPFSAVVTCPNILSMAADEHPGVCAFG